MGKYLYMVIICALILTIAGCANDEQVTSDTLTIRAATTELGIKPSTNQVEEFLNINQKFISSYDTDTCFNITPDFVAENSKFSVFKYSISSGSFLLYDGEVYSLGMFGGLTSVALADLDRDHQYELYFTVGWGSGIHRSQIGYFNPAKKKVTVFDFQYFDHDMILTSGEAGTSLIVNEAAIEYVSLVDFKIKSENKLIAAIVSEKGKVKLSY
ncbi:hypothetical protein [Paenibacillus sp. FSL R7-0337]|uniref:hypothetical protein n=1 Tax=Paenibacillus sp. FSL R7-0337 TaxID=1926588 RepID=UPI0009701A9E|nr:hypothetical protein [Paenibacillus sp. FSL R7-0337]OMF89504.1 hypothetical protein BK147_25245 [Paenibacillus sp. FSL R7-0337]